MTKAIAIAANAKATPQNVNSAARRSADVGSAMPIRDRTAGRDAASVTSASTTIATAKNAAEAFVNHASAVATPATKPQIGRFDERAYAAHAATMNAVIVDSMSAARFHMTHVYSVASNAPPMSAIRRPASA